MSKLISGTEGRSCHDMTCGSDVTPPVLAEMCALSSACSASAVDRDESTSFSRILLRPVGAKGDWSMMLEGSSGWPGIVC